MQTRISQRFNQLRAANEPALIAYITAGDPTPEHTPALVAALERGGADMIELGVPFSDPIADGPVIQRASDRAIAAGTTVEKVLDIAATIRQSSEIPLILFTYLNPVLRYGFDKLAARAKEVGIDGLLLTDLSVEEAEKYVAVVRDAGLDTVFLAAPTSTERRLALIAKYSTGFVYVVSRAGITGERDQVSNAASVLVNRLRAHTQLPLGVGFGISTAAQAAEVASLADGVVVGSAIVRKIETLGTDPTLPAELEKMARELKQGAISGRK